ncbi:FAR1-related sequence 3 [Striga asiatica]|uniref:FAR1-related sequence 3 n=1 Tax=Striga asiatica TaxID=4170 RepID=A0A5A7PPC4_STRAF|nr:FAR1-related sequence 3 [Striga asiatica]
MLCHSLIASTSMMLEFLLLISVSQPTPIAINREGALADNMVVLTCFKSMTWIIENKSQRVVAIINWKGGFKIMAKLRQGKQRCCLCSLTRATLEPMLKSMANISQQLSKPANNAAAINIKIPGASTTGGSEVKFQVSKDTLGSMLRSMAYIREQL